MDQPPKKPPLSPIKRLEKLLGVDMVVRPTPRSILGRTGNRQNHVTVTDPAGKDHGVSRLGWRKKAKNSLLWKCECLEDVQGDNYDNDFCEHVKAAQEYWLNLDPIKKRG